MIDVGFTGTRFGMSPEQHQSVTRILDETFMALGIRGHHGDCIGADKEFHGICRQLQLWSRPNGGVSMVGHPPVDNENRAWCVFDVMHAPLTHMKRNKAIVDAVSVMIATPYEERELQYGGTWKTVGFARKATRPLFLVWRDGRVDLERKPLAWGMS